MYSRFPFQAVRVRAILVGLSHSLAISRADLDHCPFPASGFTGDDLPQSPRSSFPLPAHAAHLGLRAYPVVTSIPLVNDCLQLSHGSASPSHGRPIRCKLPDGSAGYRATRPDHEQEKTQGRQRDSGLLILANSCPVLDEDASVLHVGGRQRTAAENSERATRHRSILASRLSTWLR